MIKIIKISILRVFWVILKNIPLINNQDFFEISIEYMNFSPWKSKNWTGANIILRKR